MNFCNLNINITCKEDIFIRQEGKTKVIITANAQIINYANNDERYFKFLNQNYITIDGQIPLITARLIDSNFKKVEKLSGSEIVYDFFELAKNNNYKVFFLGGSEESNRMAVRKVKDTYGIQVDGFSPKYEGYPFSKEFVSSCNTKIEKFNPDILLTCIGSPKQELFVEDNIELYNDLGIKYILNCGGAIDFVSGKIKRAPKWVSNLGIEGIYRLLQEMSVKRIERIIYSFGFFKYIFGKPSFER